MTHLTEDETARLRATMDVYYDLERVVVPDLGALENAVEEILDARIRPLKEALGRAHGAMLEMLMDDRDEDGRSLLGIVMDLDPTLAQKLRFHLQLDESVRIP